MNTVPCEDRYLLSGNIKKWDYCTFSKLSDHRTFLHDNTQTQIYMSSDDYLCFRGLTEDQAEALSYTWFKFDNKHIYLDKREQVPLEGVPSLGCSTLLFKKLCWSRDSFTKELRRKLTNLIPKEYYPATESFNDSIRIDVEEAQVFKMRNITLHGYSVTLRNLDPVTSLLVQINGIGTHHNMGCGVFQCL